MRIDGQNRFEGAGSVEEILVSSFANVAADTGEADEQDGAEWVVGRGVAETAAGVVQERDGQVQSGSGMKSFVIKAWESGFEGS